MLTIPPRSRIYPAVEATDMRKGVDGLQLAVRSVIEKDPLSGTSSSSVAAAATA